jgi:AcrR family transcriptional regulator
VSDVKPQRLEYVEQTRDALLSAAEQLFVTRGYASTSIDAVATEARFTKGAVYRHFSDKRALFTAVFERVEIDMMSAMAGQLLDGEISWETATDALSIYLDACTDHRFRRIVLEEAPAVLGWQTWRELDQQYTGDLLRQILSGLMDAGEIPRQPVDLAARLCCATVGEGALAIAQSDNPEETKDQIVLVLARMFAGLRIGPTD